MKKAFQSIYQIEYNHLKIYYSFSNFFIFKKIGETSLHVATRYGHPHVVEHLCRLGGNVDWQDDVSYIPR